MIVIVQSFMRLPLWVQIWVAIWLFPMNLGGLFFLDDPVGRWCAVLGIVGMAPNMIIMWRQRGLSKAMAFPHLIPWTILVIWLALVLSGETPPAGAVFHYAWAMLATNTISLIFDYRDAWQWWNGDRETA